MNDIRHHGRVTPATPAGITELRRQPLRAGFRLAAIAAATMAAVAVYPVARPAHAHDGGADATTGILEILIKNAGVERMGQGGADADVSGVLSRSVSKGAAHRLAGFVGENASSGMYKDWLNIDFHIGKLLAAMASNTTPEWSDKAKPYLEHSRRVLRALIGTENAAGRMPTAAARAATHIREVPDGETDTLEPKGDAGIDPYGSNANLRDIAGLLLEMCARIEVEITEIHYILDQHYEQYGLPDHTSISPRVRVVGEKDGLGPNQDRAGMLRGCKGLKDRLTEKKDLPPMDGARQ